MEIDNIYEIGNIVYLKTCTDQKKMIVTGILVRELGHFCYELTNGQSSSYHYEFEITDERDIIQSTSN